MGQKIPVWEMVDDLVLQSTAFIQERCQKKAVRAQPKTLWRKSLNTRGSGRLHNGPRITQLVSRGAGL